MRSHHLFLLVYLLGSCFGPSNAQRNETCPTSGACDKGPASDFLQCVGLPSTDTGRDHMRRLKGMLQAAMDVYTFMRSSMTGVPLLSLQAELVLNPEADPLQNEALVQMWMEVQMKPLLRSINKHFLSCLSTEHFSCSTYQMVVRELSYYYSEMSPARQQWIYTFFMHPFLSAERVAGCVFPEQSSEEWLMKNFGAFRVSARLEELSTLNMLFSGLEVLHLLSPAQKAELLLRPEVAALDNGNISLVFHSLATGGPGRDPQWTTPGRDPQWTTPGRDPQWTNPGEHNWTGPGYPYTEPPPSPHSVRQVVNGFMTAFKPVGSFVHDFVSFTKERGGSEVRSSTLTQFLLNWTLAELADAYRPPGAPETPGFDVSAVEDWYGSVVLPVLRRLLPDAVDPEHQNVKLAFHQLFYLDQNAMDNDASEVQDVCSVTLNNRSCGVTDAVANVAKVLHCAAGSQLTLSEQTVMSLMEELTERLNLLIQELLASNMAEVASDFQQIFGEAVSPPPAEQHLDDPAFIRLWFQIKLVPLLPDVPTGLLSCLSTNNFSCPAYQTIVAGFSEYSRRVYDRHDVYDHFLHPFLLNHNSTDPQCVSSADNSTEWLTDNFGDYVTIPSVADFYDLNPTFSGLEVLHLLTSRQISEMLLLPLPTPPEKDVVIDQVFDFLLESPGYGTFRDVLGTLHYLPYEIKPSCNVFKKLLERLYAAVPLVPRDVEPDVWTAIEEFRNMAPADCLPANLTCQTTPSDNTSFCSGVNSSELLHVSTSMEVSCNFSLETYACAQLENFTANQLVSLLECNLPGNSRNSKVLWKLLLTKLSSVLDPALDLLSAMPTTTLIPSASVVLDVIGELRVLLLTDEQLTDSAVVELWFPGRLGPFLAVPSGGFLLCLSGRNLSCQTYQQILQQFIERFDNMDPKSRNAVVNNFILPFLSQPHSGPGCVSASNGSAEWLTKNMGPFSRLMSISKLQQLDPDFDPLEVLHLLSPAQSAELLVLILPDTQEKDTVMNAIFDTLTPNGTLELLQYLILVQSERNLSCSAQKTLFARLELIESTLPLHQASMIVFYETELSKFIPPGCIIYSRECNVIMANETDICAGVNSLMLQLQLDSGEMSGGFCDHAIEKYACASLTALTKESLVTLLACEPTSSFSSSSSSSSSSVWKLLLSKASPVLDGALDLLTKATLDPTNPSVPIILEVMQQIRLDGLNPATLNDIAFIKLWFRGRLRPFLPAVTPDFLSCLAAQGLSCATYQEMVQILSDLQPDMTPVRQISVYTHFIKAFLTRANATDSGCSSGVTSSGEWLQKNLGGFSALASFRDLQTLYSDFSAMSALPQLTVRQLADVSATPGQLASPAQVTAVMKHVPDQSLPAFFDDFSPAIVGNGNQLPSAVRSAMLQVVFDRANLSDRSVGDSAISLWLRGRLRPLLVDLSPAHVEPFFGILTGRNCSVQQLGVEDLNSTISSLNEETKKEIYDHIVQTLRGPTPLSCYGSDDSQSFYGFLRRSFLGFQFPNLTTFLSLMPGDRKLQLVNSVPPSDLGDFLRLPDVVDDDAELCDLYDLYGQTPAFLETESLPAAVRRPTLPCVWPAALASSERSEVAAWFDRRLPESLVFLTKSLVGPDSTHNASCLAFQKLVSVLGEYNYTAAAFRRSDVFDSIRSYLASATVPRCYDDSDPELNSTAWFSEYVGPFMSFLTLEDLQAFGSAQVLQVFSVNPLNIAALDHAALPANLTDYYTELVYQQDANFNPLLLPLACRCVAPGPAFIQLTAEESVVILYNLTTLCSALDPQVSAALAGNLGNSIDAAALSALGNESTGMSAGQIKSIDPQHMLDSLATLSSVSGWNLGQAKAIVTALSASDAFQINGSSLLMLGSLIAGVPSGAMANISGAQLLAASKDPAFLENILTAPSIVQQTFVSQIIAEDGDAEAIIQNVPDGMATRIPRALLLGFPNNGDVIRRLNRHTWGPQQAQLFFDVMAVESATDALGGPDNLSSSVLQGFTCTGVRAVKSEQIKKLIKACRRTGDDKVHLEETQLTCMYNHIKADANATAFDVYPPDVMLYYDYALVPQAGCRSYFQQLGGADFSVFSPTLSYKSSELIANARSCLGITSDSLTEDDVSVLGNMCCSLNASYIQNSDPSILEQMKGCAELSAAQAAAVEALLSGGATLYGAPSMWNESTLQALGMLPLYMTSTFYKNFDKKLKKNFLRYFLKENRQVDRRLKRALKAAMRASIKRFKRSAVNECTVGTITQVTISDEIFPFDYDDVNQFNSCLSAAVVRDNLEAITEKVDQEEYLQVVLSKLREVYSTVTVPEDQVQLLGPASRVATAADVEAWAVTQVDTLASLMDPANGPWDPSLAKAVVSRYLSHAGNQLGGDELNSVGGANLCALDVDVLRNISQQSIRDAGALTLTSCSEQKKKELFAIAERAFASSPRSTVTASSYRLTQPYLGGATSEYVKSLVASNVNMDLETFTSLEESLALNLTVGEVRALLGSNLAALQAYREQPLVKSWTGRQSQAELDTLGIGLTGGRVDPTTPSPTTPNPNPNPNPGTPNPNPGTPNPNPGTTSGNYGFRADAACSVLALLSLLVSFLL